MRSVACHSTDIKLQGLSFLAIPFLYPSEINSNRSRNRGASIAMVTNWLCVYIVVSITPVGKSSNDPGGSAAADSPLKASTQSVGASTSYSPCSIWLGYRSSGSSTLRQRDSLWKRSTESSRSSMPRARECHTPKLRSRPRRISKASDYK